MSRKRTPKFQAQIEEIARQSADIETELRKMVRAIRRLPAGDERAALEDRAVRELRIDPSVFRTPAELVRDGWTAEKWFGEAISLKTAGRAFRKSGLLDKAIECEAGAKAADAKGRELRGRKS